MVVWRHPAEGAALGKGAEAGAAGATTGARGTRPGARERAPPGRPSPPPRPAVQAGARLTAARDAGRDLVLSARLARRDRADEGPHVPKLVGVLAFAETLVDGRLVGALRAGLARVAVVVGECAGLAHWGRCWAGGRAGGRADNNVLVRGGRARRPSRRPPYRRSRRGPRLGCPRKACTRRCPGRMCRCCCTRSSTGRPRARWSPPCS
jgi:hypothetical protein